MPSTETRIAVVIPYYQRSPKPLEAALGSVYAQNLPAGCKLEVIIVDDSSPSPAAMALTSSPRRSISIRTIKQPNGGPAAARNTGLHASDGTDYIAFLDSDDRWEENHLARALATLGVESDFYFCDQNLGDLSRHSTYFQQVCAWYDGTNFRNTGLPISIVARNPNRPVIIPVSPEGSFVFRESEGLTALLRVFLPHISCTVIRTKSLGHIRFCADLKNAGEDYLYFLMLANAARSMCYSRHIGVTRGRGVSIYFGATGWDNPRSLEITLDNHRSFLLARGALTITRDQKRILSRRISFKRLEFVARLLSELVKRKNVRYDVLFDALRADPRLSLGFPIVCCHLLIRRALGMEITDGKRSAKL